MKQILYLSLALLLVCMQAQGQNSEVDSLKALIQNTTEQADVPPLYLALGNQFKKVSLDSVEYYYAKAIENATCPTCSSVRVESLIAMSRLKGFMRDTSTIDYLLEAHAVCKAQKDTTTWVNVHMLLGSAFLHFDQREPAKRWYAACARLAREASILDKANRAHASLGYLYSATDLYDSATIHYMAALELNVQQGKKESHKTLLNIGANYFRSGNDDMAMQYYKKALQRSIEEEDASNIASCHQNLGALYTKKQELELAMEHLSKANEIYKAQNDSSAMATYHASIADIHVQQNEMDKALESYLMAKKVFPVSGTKDRRLFVHLNLSRTYLTQSQGVQSEFLQKAINEGSIAHQLANEVSNTTNQLESASILFRAHKALGQYSKACAYAEESISLQDSLFAKERLNAIADVQEKYETEKRELEIELLSKGNALKEAALVESQTASTQQRYIIVAALIGLVLTLALALLMQRLANQRKKANQELLDKNNTIASQNEEKELLLKEIHHRVKNNLQVVSSLLDLQSKKAGEDEKAALAEGQSRVKAMALIHEKLYQSKSVSQIDFEEYCTQLCQQIGQLFPQGKLVDCKVEVTGISLDIDTAIPVGLILNELITNAYKYAFHEGGGSLRITAKKGEENDYLLRVEDDGNGLPDGFDWRKSKSLGLRLVHRLARQLYGKAEYSNLSKSTFEITFKDSIERKKVA